MDQSARNGYGVAIVVLSTAFLLLCVPVLLIFFIDKEFRRAPAYIIMTHIGVADALQLLIHIYSGVLVIANADVSAISNKVIGAILTGLWFTMLAFTLFLTFNRLITVLLHKWFPVLLSPTITYMLFFLSYLGFIVPLVLKLTPDCNYVFDPDTFSWSFLPTDRPASIVMSEMGRYLVLAIVVLSVITYISIFVYIGLFSAAKLSKRELRITIQVSLVVLYFLFSFVYWNYLMALFGKSTLNDFLSCLVWVVMNGIHPIIYIIFNERLRHSFVYLFTHLRIPRDVSSTGRTVFMVKAGDGTRPITASPSPD